MVIQKTDYAVNKEQPDAIVWTSVTGEVIRLTRKDFGNEEEFMKWKEWSDSDYAATEKSSRMDDHCYPLRETDFVVQSSEDILLSDLLQNEEAAYAALLISRLQSHLTQRQYRRMWMRYVDGLSVTEIAKRESVAKAGISISLRAAKKIFLKFRMEVFNKSI